MDCRKVNLLVLMLQFNVPVPLINVLILQPRQKLYQRTVAIQIQLHHDPIHQLYYKLMSILHSVLWKGTMFPTSCIQIQIDLDIKVKAQLI